MKISSLLIILCLFLLFLTSANAASCSANNDVGDSCSIDCAVGQKAQCSNAAGAGKPVCECEGNQIQDMLKKSFKTYTEDIKVASPEQGKGIQQTNAKDLLNNKLANLRDYRLSQSCALVGSGKFDCQYKCHRLLDTCDEVCIERKINRCNDIFGKLNVVEPLNMISEPVVKVQEPNWKGIPVGNVGRKLEYLNCNPNPQNQTFKIQENTMVGSRVQMTKAVGSTTSVSAKVGFSFFANAEMSASFSQNVNLTKVDEQSFQEARQINEDYPLSLPPMTYTTFEILWQKIDVPVKFSGTVILDAPLIQNMEGVTVLSQVIPNESDRSVDFEGVVFNTLMLKGNAKIYSRKTTEKECSGEAKEETKLIRISPI